jgi:membrane protease YdiL (CAAX protease family)
MAAYVGLLLALGWPVMIAGPRGAPSPVLTLVGPSACAFVVTFVAHGGAGVRELAGRVLIRDAPWWLYLFTCVGVGACVMATAYAVTVIIFPTGLTAPPASALVPLALNFVIIFVLAGLGEEFGWRGFALPRLQDRWGPVRGTTVVGLLWFLWHVPLIVGVDGWPTTLVLFFALVMADSVVHTWVFNRSGGSVLLAALMHAAGNTWGGLLHRSVFSFEPPGYPFFDAVRVGTYLVLAVVVLVATRGRLGVLSSPSSGPPSGRG